MINIKVKKYSKIGERHKCNNECNQDYVFINETEDGIFFAVADGVSSCKNSRRGAEIACKVSANVILDDLNYYFSSQSDKTINIVLSNIRSRINAVALKEKQEAISYASTLCFLCINKRSGDVLSFVLGDSRIYLISPNEVKLSNPVISHGENETCTTLTECACDEVSCSVKKYSKNMHYLLCTDGCWKELFYTDINDQIIMRETKLGKLSDYLDRKTINDDCTFLFVA